MESGPLALLFSAVTLTTICASAQTDWRTLFGVDRARVGHRIASTPTATMVFGGTGITADATNIVLAETAVWDGVLWRTTRPAAEPSPRYGHAMAGDIATGRVILFGGTSDRVTAFGDTWEWNGATWLQLAPAVAPTARWGAALAYDVTRHRAVLFGGTTALTPPLADTWEWDGLTWSQAQPVNSPGGRFYHAMAHDIGRGVTVMFGRTPAGSADTWEWDGTDWRLVQPTTSPPPLSNPSLAFDLASGRTLLFGGDGLPTVGSSELWSWDGTNWSPLTPASALRPLAQTGSAIAYDFATGRAVVYGGSDSRPRGDTFLWDGQRWQTPCPPPRAAAALALDPATGDGILFGGRRQLTTSTYGACDDTWGWSGGTWGLLQPATVPPARHFHAMVRDAARQRTVLFGGQTDQLPLGDTWLWDGANWAQQTVTGPPARLWGAMAYDAARREVVLFGGVNLTSQQYFQDTWAWNGASWSQRAPANAPTARAGCGLAFDTARSRAVLFGGFAPPTVLAETWEWDGTTWTQSHPAHVPQGAPATLVYDPQRRRTVLLRSSPWEWDGTDWTERVVPNPVPVAQVATAFDARLQRILSVGGVSGDVPLAIVTSYGPEQPAALAPFGSGCAGSAGTPLLREADGALPWLGDTVTLRVEPVPANAPALLAIGLSDATFAGVALPAPLAAIGMPGCTLLVSLDLEFLTLATGARADFALALPSTQALLGLPWFAQAAALDAAANPAGIVASDALAGVLGSR